MQGLRTLFEEHPFAVLGAGLGLLWGILALRLGFLAAFFLFLITAFGLWVGRQFDRQGGDDLQDLFDRIVNRQERD